METEKENITRVVIMPGSHGVLVKCLSYNSNTLKRNKDYNLQKNENQGKNEIFIILSISLIDKYLMYERHLKIIELVRSQEYVSVEKLAQYFNVTLQTIRRDINKLAKDGLLSRHHGGASLPKSVDNITYKNRQTLQVDAKMRIAKLLSEHIPNNASIFINIGTTTEESAKALLNKKGLTVITNNINVATILSASDTSEIVLAGGIVRKRDWGITGEATIDFIKQFKVDYGIIGISGIDEDGTLLDFDYNEVRVARTIIKNARKVCLVADHTKFERNAIVCLCHISEVDAFFTDKTPPPKMQEILAASGVELFVANPDD